MSYVADASALFSVFVTDGQSGSIRLWLRSATRSLTVVDFAAAETSAAFQKAVRVGLITQREAAAALADFDNWRRQRLVARELRPSDVSLAEAMVRNPRTKLAASDAVYLAVAQNDGATLVTFDKRQAEAASLLGIASLVPR